MLSIQSSYTENSDLILNGRPARFGADSASAGGCLSQASLCPLFCAGRVYFQEMRSLPVEPSAVGFHEGVADFDQAELGQVEVLVEAGGENGFDVRVIEV